MTTMASQITNLTIVYSIVYSDADTGEFQRSVTRKLFPFDDVIMIYMCHDLRVPIIRTKLGEWNIRHRGTIVWNSFLHSPYLKECGILWFHVEAARRPPPTLCSVVSMKTLKVFNGLFWNLTYILTVVSSRIFLHVWPDQHISLCLART